MRQELEAQVERLEEEKQDIIANFSSEYAELEDSLKESQTASKSQKINIEELMSEIKRANEKIQFLENNVIEAGKVKSDLEETQKNLRIVKETNSIERKNFEKEMLVFKQRVQELTEELEASARKQDSGTIQLQDEKRDIISNFKAEKSELQSSLKESMDTVKVCKRIIEELKVEAKVSNDTIALLKNDVISKKKNEDLLNETKDKLNSLEKIHQMEKRNNEEKVSEYDEKVQKLTLELETLQRELHQKKWKRSTRRKLVI